jgi:integrase/recombinase XerD
VDLDAGLILQDARVVRTKFSKTFPTYFVPVGDDIREIVESWVRHLKEVLLWGPDDPLFPRTRVVSGTDRRFKVNGLERTGWRTSAPIRAIVRKAFEALGVPYFNPHSFRHALTRHGQTICATLEDHKAFSQDLGHSSIKTTEMHYGEIPAERQGQLIRGLGKREKADATAVSLARELLERLGGAQK